MSEEIELRLLRENEELRKRLNRLEGKNIEGVPTYSFSKIKLSDLEILVNLEKKYDFTIFKNWFETDIIVTQDDISFFKNLIERNIQLIVDYNEEDLKAKFIIPLLNRVDFLFLENSIRDFYEEKLFYKTDKFIFNGTADFFVAKGLRKAKTPYFFIQEFKKGQTDGYPESQLLAELISAVELNRWNTIKGAYIVGAIWNFVILEKLEKDSYQYFVSINFDSTKIEDLKAIYKNLLSIKKEIIERVKNEN